MQTATRSAGKTASPKASGVPEAQLIIDLTETDLPASTAVYVYIVGLVVDTYYYIDNNGMPQVMSTADNTQDANTFPGMHKLSKAAQDAIKPSYPLKWADWSIPVQVGGNQILPLGNINTTNIPNLGTGTAAFSGRVYFSVGVPKLPFTVQSSGYTAPVYGAGSGVTGSLTLFDWIEFSYDSEGNFDGNTTQVNQFGFPLFLTGTPQGGKPFATQGRLNTARTKILKAIAGASSPLGGSAVMVPVPKGAAEAYPPKIEYLRAISPVTVSGDGSSLNTYFNNDLTAAYTAWQATPLVTTDGATGSYSGVVFPLTGHSTVPAPPGYPTGSLAFYQGSYPTMADFVAKFPTPPAPAFYLTGSSNLITSNDIWQCAGSLANGGTAQKNVGKMIAAAFNRGMIVNGKTVVTSLTDINCSKQSGSFYSAGTTFNPWAQAFHLYSKNKLAYGFPYDDVCDQNSSIPPSGDSLVASFIRMTLGKFHS